MTDLVTYIKESSVMEWSPAPATAAYIWLKKSQENKWKSGGKTSTVDTVKFVHHILDVMYEMADNKEKNFGIKFDEICGNLVSHLWLYSKTLSTLESNHYIRKTGNLYYVLLTTTTKENTIPCEESIPIYELPIPNYKTMQSVSDDAIKEAVIKAVDRLKKTVKLY